MDSKDIQVMHDIETLSQKKNAVILSIGAVKFNATEIIDTFYVNIDPRSAKDAGLHIDPSTVEWWKKQDPKVHAALKENRQEFHAAMQMYRNWYGEKSVPTWGNGSDFDNVILENAFFAADMTPPWKYFHNRCYRTMTNMFNIKLPKHGGDLHNAMDDAIAQTKALQTILQATL